MRIERIHHSDIDGGDGIVAVIVYSSPFAPGVQFVTEHDSPMQVGYIRHPIGHTCPPHIHTDADRRIAGTSEVLLVKRGRMRVSFYSSLGVYVDERTLTDGDLIVLLRGGHGIEMIEETELIEVKQGPYLGPLDKVRFTPGVPYGIV